MVSWFPSTKHILEGPIGVGYSATHGSKSSFRRRTVDSVAAWSGEGGARCVANLQKWLAGPCRDCCCWASPRARHFGEQRLRGDCPMADAKGNKAVEQPSAIAAAASPEPSSGGELVAATQLLAASGDGEPDPPASGGEEAGGDDSDAASDVFRGRPDLSQDALQDLRSKHRELKLEQKRVELQLKAQERKRARILRRMRHLDTAAVMQVLMERGVDFAGQSAVTTAASEPGSPVHAVSMSGVARIAKQTGAK